MQFKITTLVHQSTTQVFAQFNEELFVALNPPIIPARLLRFDGCHKGAEVHVQIPPKQLWISVITDFQQNATAIYFIDEARKLPFFLRYWQHRHIIRQTGNDQTAIIDDITYKSPFLFLDYLLFPILYLQFLWRKPVYQRFFGKPNNT